MQEENQNDQSNCVDFEVEKIVDRRKTTAGLIQYLVKWHKYPETQNSWEPVNFLINCVDRIVDYKKKQKKGGSSKNKNSSQGAVKKPSSTSQQQEQSPQKVLQAHQVQIINEPIAVETRKSFEIPVKVTREQKPEKRDKKQKIQILGLYLDLSGSKVYLVEKENKEVVKMNREKMEQQYLSELCKYYEKFINL